MARSTATWQFTHGSHGIWRQRNGGDTTQRRNLLERRPTQQQLCNSTEEPAGSPPPHIRRKGERGRRPHQPRICERSARHEIPHIGKHQGHVRRIRGSRCDQLHPRPRPHYCACYRQLRSQGSEIRACGICIVARRSGGGAFQGFTASQLHTHTFMCIPNLIFYIRQHCYCDYKRC